MKVRTSRLQIETLEERALLTGGLAHADASAGLAQKPPLPTSLVQLVQPISTQQTLDQLVGAIHALSPAAAAQLGADLSALDAAMETLEGGLLANLNTASTATALGQSLENMNQPTVDDLRSALEAQGVSAAELDRLFGRGSDITSPLFQAILDQQGHTQGDNSQPLYPNQPGSPIQVGSRTNTDTRSTDEADDPVVSQSPSDENNAVHITYQSGKTVDVSSDNTVTFHNQDNTTTDVMPDGTVVTTLHDGTTISDEPNGHTSIATPHWDNEGNPSTTILTFSEDETLLTVTELGGPYGDLSTFDMQTGDRIYQHITWGEIWQWVYDANGNLDHTEVIPYDPSHEKILNTQMPNPDAPDRGPGVSQQEWQDKFVNSVTLPGSEFGKAEADVAKLAGRTAAALMSTVNPNPEAPTFDPDSGLPNHILGPGQGDPPDDHPIHGGPSNTGGNPGVVFGLGKGPRGGY
jgi:hypothetical protein